MSYSPTTWKSGDVVTSAKLNNIESGIVNAVHLAPVIVDFDANTMTATETAADLWAASQVGAVVFVLYENDAPMGTAICISSVLYEGTYEFEVHSGNNYTTLTATSGTGYPTATM